MCPQIVGWFAAYGVLKHLEEAACYLVGRHVGWGACYKPVGGCVVAAARPAHLHIEHGVVHLAHDALATCKDRSVPVVEERQPQVDVGPLGALVANVAAHVAHTLAAPVDNVSQRLVLWYRTPVGLVRPYLPEQVVEHLVAQRMVYKAKLTLGRQVYAHTRQPLPVAVVAQYGSCVLSLAETLLHLLAVDNGEPAAQLAVAYAQELYRLKEVVAEPVVELALGAAQIGLPHLGKGCRQIAAHKLASIPHEVVDKHKPNVGKHVQHPHRQQGQGVEQGVYYLCHSFGG